MPKHRGLQLIIAGSTLMDSLMTVRGMHREQDVQLMAIHMPMAVLLQTMPVVFAEEVTPLSMAQRVPIVNGVSGVLVTLLVMILPRVVKEFKRGQEQSYQVIQVAV